MIAKVADYPEVHVSLSAFDADPYVLVVRNGTLRLSNDVVFEPLHRREDMATKALDVDFDIAVDCPLFMDFIMKATAGSWPLIDYLQRLYGMSLVGRVPGAPQVWFICKGGKSTGKTTYGSVLRRLLGPHAALAPDGLFVERRSEMHPADIDVLRHKRFVLVEEMANGRATVLDVGRVKRLTGAEGQQSRAMRENFTEWRPGCVIMALANASPRVPTDIDLDDGIYRRTIVVPFNHPFQRPRDRAEAEYHIVRGEAIASDVFMETIMAQELSGVLNWALEGYVRWREISLDEPEEVRTATQAWRDSASHLLTRSQESGAWWHDR
jgi:putative DNA primase/helicase